MGSVAPIMAGAGPPSTTLPPAAVKVVDADPGLRSGQAPRRHDGNASSVRQSFGRLVLQPGLLEAEDRPRTGLGTRHQAVDVQEFIRTVCLAADRAYGTQRRRSDPGGEARIGATAGELAIGRETGIGRGADIQLE